MEKSNRPLNRCPNPIGAFSGITIDGKKVVAGSLRCNMWECRFCRERLKKKLFKRILTGAIGEELSSPYSLKFLTLTFGGTEARINAVLRLEKENKSRESEGEPPLSLKEYIYNIMIHNFHKLIRALKKKYGQFHYFRVCELHKDGIPHFHILFAGDAIAPKHILDSIENLWRGFYGMGYVKINCVRFRDKKHAVRYMLKYITKDIQKVGKWKRIFSASRGSLTKIEKMDWFSVNVQIGRVTDRGLIEIELDEARIKETLLPDFKPVSQLALDTMKFLFQMVVAPHSYQPTSN
ncbi:MAG TPA: hypothetical protein DHV36_11625 [Desulfobacteraceae bacterium]|nr:hypothetical protein [Desulfobacteraceae bacterium]